MKRLVALALLTLALTSAVVAERRRSAAPPHQPAQAGDPFLGLSPAEMARFNAGKAIFKKDHTIAEGLGPVMNGTSCEFCHGVGGFAGGSSIMVTRVGTTTNGRFDPLERFGGQVLQVKAVGPLDGASHSFRAERVPGAATIIARRRSLPLWGLGLVDATPDATFIALAAEQAARNDGTAGRVSIVENLAAGMPTVGKFGWKSAVATLLDMVGDAYLNELGVTSAGFPTEHCPVGDCNELRFNPAPGINSAPGAVEALTDLMILLAPPPRGPITGDVIAGETVFNAIGCNSCHVSTLRTGPSDIRALDRVNYHPFSDFLLHDMGSLGDRIEQGAATGREMRTAPLWGLRLMEESFLHHGGAKTIEAAITGHDGQARASRDRFNALNAEDRSKLMAFLRSL